MENPEDGDARIVDHGVLCVMRRFVTMTSRSFTDTGELSRLIGPVPRDELK